MQNTVTQSFIGLLALSTMCGVLVHDTHIDKVTIHAMTHLDNSDGGKVSVSSNPHTHSERSSFGGKAQAATARDPREDKGVHQGQTDYFRLPGSPDTDNTLILA